MSGDGRRAATLALVLLFAAPAASLRQGEKLGEDYLRVSTSVAVIHARGREVTAEGLVRGPMSARRATRRPAPPQLRQELAFAGEGHDA